MTKLSRKQLAEIRKHAQSWLEDGANSFEAMSPSQALALLDIIEAQDKALRDIIKHMRLIGGGLSEHSASIRIARAALLPDTDEDTKL